MAEGEPIKSILHESHLLIFAFEIAKYIFFLLGGGFLIWLIKGNWRFYKNIRRPVIMFAPADAEFKQEFIDLRLFIEDTKTFKVPESPSATTSCDRISDHSVIILAFDNQRQNWKKIFEKAAQKNVPIIIYTFGNNRVEDKEMKEISQNYAYYTYAQNRLSLINCLYTTLATFNSYAK